MVRTPDDAHALTNWPDGGIITKFTITGWAKSEGARAHFHASSCLERMARMQAVPD